MWFGVERGSEVFGVECEVGCGVGERDWSRLLAFGFGVDVRY